MTVAPFAHGVCRGGGDGLRHETTSSGRVLIVANRLPVTVVPSNGGIEVRRSSGGLVSGLTGVQRQYASCWIGWTGLANEPSADVQHAIDAHLLSTGAIGIHLTDAEIAGFYLRYSNGVLWPVLHDMDVREQPMRDWDTYRAVNERYAREVIRRLQPGDMVWIHDYHLMLVPRLVRRACPWAPIGFFLHTPFPSPDSLCRLPHAKALLDGLLGADVIGVHTPRYAEAFMAALRRVLPSRARRDPIDRDGRRVHVLDSPIGVDVRALGAIAAQREVAKQAMQIRDGVPLLLGVDRLDYTKGIPQRLRAFERVLESDPGLHGRIRLLQIAVPSRQDVSGYGQIRHEVEACVERINHRWGRSDWTPVEYRYVSVDPNTLAALYRAADVMLVTPLADGMNLVAKEYVAARVDGDGVLVLSNRAGAAEELRTALLVDPTDEGAIASACVAAITMLPAERRVRMRRLRAAVATNDVYRWATSFLDTLAGIRLAGSEASLA